MRHTDIKTKAIKALKNAFAPLAEGRLPHLSCLQNHPEEDKVVLFGTAFDTITVDRITKQYIEEFFKNDILRSSLILTDVIPQDIAETMQKSEINFCDTAGNFQICIAGIRLSNIEPEFMQSKSTTSINLNTLATLKVIFTLLRYKHAIQWPMRRLADAADVSLGSVQRVIETLKKHALIFLTPNGKFFKNKKELLEIWVKGFNSIILPKITLGHAIFRNVFERVGWQKVALTDGIMWGGEPAAQLLDGYLIAADLSIFTSMDFRATAKTLNLVPTDSTGYISILKKFWRDDTNASSNEQKNTAPVLIVYAQLMGNFDSRCRDAAQRLLSTLEDEELSE